jgi:alpha-ribazole phosphatase
MKIFLIRHCLTKQSENKFIKDDDKDFSLSSTGVLEAKNLQRFFKKIKINNVFISNTKRSRETANIVFPKHKAKLITVDAFNELNKGFKFFLLANSTKGKMSVIEWENIYNTKADVSKIKFKYPSGENIMSYSNVVIKKFVELIAFSRNKNIAIVAHNGSIKAIVAYVLGNIDVYTKFCVCHGTYSEIFCDDDNNDCKLISLNKL